MGPCPGGEMAFLVYHTREREVCEDQIGVRKSVPSAHSVYAVHCCFGG